MPAPRLPRSQCGRNVRWCVPAWIGRGSRHTRLVLPADNSRLAGSSKKLGALPLQLKWLLTPRALSSLVLVGDLCPLNSLLNGLLLACPALRQRELRPGIVLLGRLRVGDRIHRRSPQQSPFWK